MRIFSKFRAPSFLHCVFYRLRHGRQGFWDFSSHFEVEGPEIFGTGMCDRTAGFYHVLSVFVVLSVSVESAMECQMTCLMNCFCDHCSKKPPSTTTQAFSLRTQALPIFSNISRLPAMSFNTRGSKVPAILPSCSDGLAARAAGRTRRTRRRRGAAILSSSRLLANASSQWVT